MKMRESDSFGLGTCGIGQKEGRKGRLYALRVDPGTADLWSLSTSPSDSPWHPSVSKDPSTEPDRALLPGPPPHHFGRAKPVQRVLSLRREGRVLTDPPPPL